MKIFFKLSLSIFFIYLLNSPFPINGQEKSDWKSSELILPDHPDYDPGWGNNIDKLQNLEILKSVDPSISSEWMEKAAEEYRNSLEEIRRVESDIEKKREDFSMEENPADRFEWQKKARQDAQEKELARMLYNGRNNAVQYLIRGMKYMEKIENPTLLESENYLDLKAGLYREYAKHQFAMKNYIQVADMLDRYIQLNDRFYKESEPHKLLAVSYEKLEIIAKKNRNVSLYNELKEKKKRHLVTFAELHYGKDSGEFNRIMDSVMRDY